MLNFNSTIQLLNSAFSKKSKCWVRFQLNLHWLLELRIQYLLLLVLLLTVIVLNE